MKRFLLMLLGLISIQAVDVMANGALSGAMIDTVVVDANGLGFVKFTQALQGSSPSCILPAYASALAFNTNTAGGRSLLAVLLSAKSAGAAVDVGGNGGCTALPNQIEDLLYVVAH